MNRPVLFVVHLCHIIYPMRGAPCNNCFFLFLLSRALYFTAYSQAKQLYNRVFPYESAAVHLASAVTAGDTISILFLSIFLNFTLWVLQV